MATVRLLRRASADIVGTGFVTDLPILGNADRVSASDRRQSLCRVGGNVLP